ncbi:carotenoid 1,2-hydratase [Frankia sp. AgB1.9]|uniref:lipocalin family protein n=1 Tax=unclassified Frankia TaxID=2632575 RepID=UPI001931C7D6|nr:carotenoid 1,2-hydratase [Frankia sp. AgW1.1]MBL7550447.1 carotenoid 1,2-hydratase [Frankia sp. AgB1.9]MBL7620547.1 carotenoid 1,2-hydratase [Frankia sp. AgB1.8]
MQLIRRSHVDRRRHRRLATFLGALCVPFLLVLASTGASAAAPVSLPADEVPHPSSPMEWWYFTGHLQGTDAFGGHHEYGFEETIIRLDALGTAPTATAYDGQLAISDITRGTFKQNMSMFSLQPDVIPSGGGFNNTVGTIHMDGKNGVNHLSGGFADLSYSSINLTLSQSTPTALHGNAGIIPYGPFGQSAYYSQTNLKAKGTLFDHGLLVNVTGIAWQDHQWGQFAPGTGGWDWYSIQLSNNTQYMLYFIKDANQQIVQTVGTLVHADGSTTNLDPTLISETALGTWTSPHTGHVFDQKWKVNLPGGSLTITPQLADQELYVPVVANSTTGSYWEGSSNVTGTIDGQAVTGQSYVELTPTFAMFTKGFIFDAIKQALGL